MNLDKSINKLSERMEVIESQDSTNKVQIDPDPIARQKYEEYKEHWYFHKSSWYMRGANGYDGKGCNQYTGCIPQVLCS
ncbi:MAG TPA: hypothetical protein VE573_15905 [Nitrososphaeraceae archaeon]|nr:hypothetical protein [Nitrososphaeraceae archaeon]